MRNRLYEKSYDVETTRGVVRRNRVHLRRTDEPAPSLSDTEVPEQADQQVVEPQSSVSATPAPVQKDVLPRSLRVSPEAAKSPVKPMLRRSEGVRRPPRHFKDFVSSKP